MAHQTTTERDTYELTALVLRRLIAAPATHTATTLAEELGETPRRVQRAVAAGRKAGWRIESAWGEQGPLVVRLERDEMPVLDDPAEAK